MVDQGCSCTVDSRTGTIVDRENGCPIHGAVVTDLIVAAWAGRGWSPTMLPQPVLDMVLVAADAVRSPLLAEVARLRAVADITDAATEGGAATHVPHIKVRIGNWYTRKIGRWT